MVKKLFFNTELVKAIFAWLVSSQYAKVKVEEWYAVQVSDTTMLNRITNARNKKIKHNLPDYPFRG